MPDDIRGSLEEAYSKLEGDGGGEESPAETPAAEAAPAETPAEPQQEADAGETPGETAEEKAQRARDEAGRFTKQPKEKPAKAAATGVGEGAAAAKPPAKGAAPGAQPAKGATPTPPAPKPAADTPKAPQSWRAMERETWAKVPPAAQAAIARRETEYAQAMAEAAPLKALARQFQSTVAPFVPFIRAEGGDVLATVGSLLETSTALRTAPPAHKAAIVANIMTTFGIPGELVAAALDGKAPPAQAPQVHPQQLIAQAKQEVMRELESQRRVAMESRYDAELDRFAETHEFADRLWDRMEKLVSSGLANDAEEAYAQAAQLDPEVRGILQQREEAKRANAEVASTQRARAAASSLRSQPLPAPGGEQSMDLRSVLERNYDSLSGGRR